MLHLALVGISEDLGLLARGSKQEGLGNTGCLVIASFRLVLLGYLALLLVSYVSTIKTLYGLGGIHVMMVLCLIFCVLLYYLKCVIYGI